MDATDRKKVSVITKYAVESFTEEDWYTLGQITGKLSEVTSHPRLLRSMSFGDDDYGYCAAEVLDTIFRQNSSSIGDIVSHFDIDLWYQQKDPDKYQRVFPDSSGLSADFWTDGYLRVFVSHLSANKHKVSQLKDSLGKWGISAFVAHEDIEPTRKWMDEVEAGLETMEVLVALVEPGFRESDWCDQEVGFALGRRVDIIPLRAGLDPYGFFGKFQGIQVKGKYADDVAAEISQVILRKPKHRDRLLQSMSKAFIMQQSEQKIQMIEKLDSWQIVTDDQMKGVLEASSLSEDERTRLHEIVSRVSAFKTVAIDSFTGNEDIPF